MDEKTPAVEAALKASRNKYVPIGFAAGLIVTGAVALVVKLKRDKDASFDDQEKTVA